MPRVGDITLSEQGIIQWKITGDLLQRFKNAEFEKVFFSTNFNAIGGKWYFGINPNGFNTEGVAHFYLVCASIECKEKELNASYYVDSASLEYSQINCDGKNITKAQCIDDDKSRIIVFNPPFLHKDIQNVHELIFRLKLWNTTSMDEAEERFLSNQCPNNKKLPNEWIECAMSQDKQVVRFLAVLGFSRCASKFEENGLHKIEDLKHLSSEELTQLGVAKLTDRKRIMAEVSEYFAVQSKDLDRGVFEWKITGGLMQQFKNAQYKKYFSGPYFKAIGCEWYFGILPNGWTTEGTAYFYIVCHSIESNEVNVSYYVDSQSLEYSQINCDGQSIKKKNDQIPFNPPFHHKDIQKKSELIFRVKLWHEASMDTVEERFVSNVLSEKKKLPKEWIECAMTPANEIWRFLALLGLEEHAPAFLKNDLHTMQDLKTVPSDDFKGMGVPHMRCKRIAAQVCVYFGIQSNPMQSNEEFKENDAHEYVDNGLVVLFGAGKYADPKTYPDLDDIIEDEKRLSDVFEDEKKFNYRFISNGEYDRLWSKTEAKEWIKLVRDKEMMKDGELQYDSLIFCTASHGSIDAMICSDGTALKHKEIRSSFAAKGPIMDIPKIFIFNGCRKASAKSGGQSGDERAAKKSVTITGSEGDDVYGSRLTRFVANAFESCRAKEMNVRDTLDVATKMAKKAMKLRCQEYDLEVGRVAFLKHPKGRGSESDPLSNTDDDLTNLLRPQKDGSKMDLFYKGYYNALFNAGFKDNKSLCTLKKDTLNGLGIKMVFHQKELIRRVCVLSQQMN